MNTPKRVVILGGGLAGLAAAVTLADRQFEVVLVERKPFLGGRASSYPAPRSDPSPRKAPEPHSGPGNASPAEDGGGRTALVDNGQHVLMKCCTNLLDFYRRIRVGEGIAFFDRYLFVDRQGALSMLKGSFLPAPLHLLPSFLSFKLLSWRDRLWVGYALFSMLREQRRLQQLDGISMFDWLCHRRQTVPAIETFWRTVLVSALNEDLEVVSARYGIQVFTEAMLKNPAAFHVGVPTVPLGKLYTEPCVDFLKARGGEVRLRNTVTGIEVADGKVAGVRLGDGGRLAGDYYLSSVPPQVLLKLLPESLVEQSDYFSKLRRFEFSPIISIYFWFDRPITELPQVAVVGREVQWVFNKKRTIEGSRRSDYFSLVVSASRKLMPLGRQEIVEIALRDLHEVMPSSRTAKLLRSVVIKEPYATFSCRVGCDRNRLDQQSPLENLWVAGDWTRTGWPPTMEGAVRSSYRCAELILEAEGRAERLTQPDLPATGISRWLWRSPSSDVCSAG